PHRVRDRHFVRIGARFGHDAPPISSRPNGSSCHGLAPLAASTSMAPGPSDTVRTLVATYWFPNHHSLTSVPERVAANSSGVTNYNAWLGHTDAHIGLSPTAVRS